jgi:hypothetical protein
MLLEIEGLTKTYRQGFRGSGVVANDGITLSTFLVLIAWCLGGLALTSFALTRRG